MMRRTFLLISLLLFFRLLLAAQEKVTDGPYIFHREGVSEILWVTEKGDRLEKFDKDLPFTVSTEDGKHSFQVTLHPIHQPAWDYPQPEKMVIISDPHGNMNAFVSILQASGVIDEAYNWSYGAGHLMLLGDIFDRGSEVVPLFWLVYKLEEEARFAGGCVHFLPGNHEDLVLQNDTRYVDVKYLQLAERLDVPHNSLWGPETELGQWLAARNTIERVGENLFTHAGLGPVFLEKEYSIPYVNDFVRTYLHVPWKIRYENEDSTSLLFLDGPLWYRGMVEEDDEYFTPVTNEEVAQILTLYHAKRLFVGHTIFDEVTSFFNGKVIAVNVDNEENMEQNRTRGVLIEKDTLYILYDQPENNREWHVR